jgi:hypothetical protein
VNDEPAVTLDYLAAQMERLLRQAASCAQECPSCARRSARPGGRMTSEEAVLLNQVARLRSEVAQAAARIETLETEAAEMRAALEHTVCERCGRTLVAPRQALVPRPPRPLRPSSACGRPYGQ